MQSLPVWMMEICTLGCVVDAAGVFLVSSETDAAVLMKAVWSNCIGLVQLGSLKVQVIMELPKLVVVMEWMSAGAPHQVGDVVVVE
jgi:hypothetical protein